MPSNYFFKGVTLLVTHYNRSASLERLLKAFKEINCQFEDIVVSDDHSDPSHFSKVLKHQQTYGFRLITSAENRGLGHNMNKGQEAVSTPYTLYIQEDFVPSPSFGEHFAEGFGFLEKRKDLDIVRFYSYVKYPNLKPYKNGFSEMIMKRWSLNYYKMYYYSDHPHLRRTTFLQKFGRYDEGRRSDRTEYLMSISFIQKRGRGLFYDDYKGLFNQRNHEEEPSTVKRSKLAVSKNPFIVFIRDIYRQIKYNHDILFLKVDQLKNIPKKRINRFNWVLNKITSAYVKLRFPKSSVEFRPFYKATYLCEIVQLKYIIRDYLLKRKYKDISFNGEFAPELQFVLPFAYWHFKNGTLNQTTSSKFTKELYFFSENHLEVFKTRSDEGNYNLEVPRVLYSQNYNMNKWLAVPLKETYRNDIYVYEKPILIIANRYNMEWSGPPISYYSIPILSYIIEKLKNRYTIIYNRAKQQNIVSDESDIYDLKEFEWLAKEHPDVILMENLYKENKANVNNFNHLQLMVYSNADHFISTHGGTAAFASYFGGTNLILSKQGPEHHFECYQKLYPKLSGATIYHARTDDEVKHLIENHYLS